MRWSSPSPGDHHEALLYDKLVDGSVRCAVCLRRCTIRPGEVGYCWTRLNLDGTLYALTYGRVAALQHSPVERKPLYHFYPGELMLSVGSVGCNFRCPGCQNWHTAHEDARQAAGEFEYVPPENLVEQALEAKSLGISWTYNEPTIWLEYTLDCARLAREHGLLTNYVTNGAITPEALALIGPYLDAFRVDLKGFSRETYQRIANFTEFEGVLEATKLARHTYGAHVECVTNLTPGVNDDPEELRALAHWIVQELDPDTPWHLTRFVPHLKLAHLPATPVRKLEEARQAGLAEGLRYVYIGNVPGHPAEDTYCPGCGRAVIQRRHVFQPRVFLSDGGCPHCQTTIAGRFRSDYTVAE